jgi:uncharacterized membrane protein
MDTLITSNDTWALWAVLLVLAALGLWLERTYVGARLSGAAFTMVFAFLLTNMGIIPADSKVYATVWTYLVPLAIPLLLFNADLRRIPRESGLTLVAFMAGVLGTMAGTIVAFYSVSLGDNAWRFAALFSATMIGGPANYHALAQSVGLQSGEALSAGLAAENLLRTIYFLVLFALPVFWGLRRSFHEPITERWGVTAELVDADSRVGTSVYLPSIASALGLSAVLCAAGYFIEARLGWNGAAILIIAGMAVVLATMLPRKMEALKGGNEIGMLLMQILFAAIGASANISAAFKVGASLFLFAGIILVVHLALILLGGKFLGLSLPEIVIASNANVGGSATSAAMAAAKRWHHLVLPAVLCGTFGYAIASLVGTALGNFLR